MVLCIFHRIIPEHFVHLCERIRVLQIDCLFDILRRQRLRDYIRRCVFVVLVFEVSTLLEKMVCVESRLVH